MISVGEVTEGMHGVGGGLGWLGLAIWIIFG